jgi:membrane-bound inhibitor of C-type lysozyme
MRVVLTLAALMLAGCQTPCPGPATGSTSVAFRCADGSELNVSFTYGPDAARVVQEGYTTLNLPARITGSGYRYAEGGAELRGRASQVHWTRPGSAETVCREQR